MLLPRYWPSMAARHKNIHVAAALLAVHGRAA
jgi:hypothetical protein